MSCFAMQYNDVNIRTPTIGDITFRPLDEKNEFNVEDLFNYYSGQSGVYGDGKENSHLKPYLHITRSSPVHPVIYDSKRMPHPSIHPLNNTLC
jgi:hypothetical protein